MTDVAALFIRWTGARAALHRGYWLVTSLYLVLDARLSPFQLVFLGTAQGILSLAAEVPAGVVADTISRKWALVIAHVLIGASMIATGLVTAFPALVLTQMIWGLGWTFASGADIAWITDELDRPERMASVLTAGARWGLLGGATGMVGFGLLAFATSRSVSMIGAGAATVAMGLFVVARFPEHGFTPTRTRRWQQSVTILRRGISLARYDREILLVLLATVIINGAAEGYERLYPRQLVALGFPGGADPMLWFTGLGILAFSAGAVALRIVEARIDGVGVAGHVYILACFIGALGMVTTAVAPGYIVGSVGVLLASGIALTVTRAVGTIWVNRRTTSDVRATMHSFMAQAEYGGEIMFGVMLGALAQLTSITLAFTCSSVLIAGAGLLVVRAGAGRR